MPDVVPPDEPLDAVLRRVELRRIVARRLGALLFAAAFLLDVLSDGHLVAAVNRLCGS